MAQHEAPTPPTDLAAAPDSPDAPAASDPEACSACPHPWPDHDALGVRFCTATIVSANSRRCICRRVPVTA